MTLASSQILNKQERLLLWLHFALILVVYAATGYYSPGFDDEYFNMMVVDRYGTGVASYILKTDAHPPLSYLINAWLYKITGRWETIRMFSGMLTASAIIFTISKLGKNKGINFSLILIYLLALNPTLLMWGTSLRWYSYLLPVLIWSMVIPQNAKWHWSKLFFSVLVMGHIGHIIYFIFPSLFLYYWLKDPRETKVKSKALLVPALLSLVLYIPQLINFFKYYLPRRGGQTFSLSTSLLGTFSTNFSNQGLFPLSIPGLAAAMGTFIVIIQLLKKLKNEWKEPYLFPFLAAQIVFLLSGIAGKMRNLFVTIPLQAIWFTEKFNATKSRWMMLAMGLIIYGNLVGTYNVIMHEDTTKNSWNLPVDQVKTFVLDKFKTDQSSVLIYCHDPIITWHLEKMGFPVRSIYANKEVNTKNKKINHVVVIWTHPGVIPKKTMELFRFEISLIKYSSQSAYILGTDKYAGIKRKKEPTYPDELVKITLLNSPEQIASSSVWSPLFIKRFE